MAIYGWNVPGTDDVFHYYLDPETVVAAVSAGLTPNEQLGLAAQVSFPCGCPPVAQRAFVEGQGPVYRCIGCGAGWALRDWLGGGE